MKKVYVQPDFRKSAFTPEHVVCASGVAIDTASGTGAISVTSIASSEFREDVVSLWD